MEQLLGILPAILPVLVPPFVKAAHKAVREKVPRRWLPLASAVGGALIGGVGSATGVEVGGAFHPTSIPVDAWQGAVTAFAGVGIHQLYSKFTKG